MRASLEAEHLKSDGHFWSHLVTHESKLIDASLSRMLRTRRILHALGVLLFTAVTIVFVFSKSSRHGF
jgi:hypothetical protein